MTSSTVIHPSLLQRKIIHVDMDCYYAAIEMLDDPSLRGKPVVVGGSPQSRGVVSTANYEARKFGIKSAMATAYAYRLCPQAVFLKPRFDRYVEISNQIRSIFRRYTDLVEPLSLDEAYLDVTSNAAGKYAIAIAKEIRAAIYEETGLTASAGVAPNKLVAKIASEIRKPNGLTVILPEQVAAFMRTMPLKRINGIGPVTAKRLAAHGLLDCNDALVMGKETLESLFGTLGLWIFEGAQGMDDRAVQPSRVRKSIGTETTFARDISDLNAMEDQLKVLAADLANDLNKRSLKGRTLTLKVRYADFKRITRAVTMSESCADKDLFLAEACKLLLKTDVASRPIRLLGLSLSRFEEQS